MTSRRLIDHLIARYKLDCSAQDSVGINHLIPQETMAYEQDSRGNFQPTFTGGATSSFLSTSPCLSGKTFSIAFDISRKGTLGAFEAYFAQYTASAAGRFIIFTVSTGSIIVAVSGTNYATSATGVIKADGKYHVVVSCNAGQPTIYVNGRSVATPSGTFTDDVLQTPTRLSGILADTWMLSGAMGDVKTYDVALTADEVSELYVESKERVKTIVPLPTVLWKLNGTPEDHIGVNDLAWAGTESYPKMNNGLRGAFFDGGEYLLSTTPAFSGRTFSVAFQTRFDAGSIKATSSLISQHRDAVAGRMLMAYSNTVGTIRAQEEGTTRTAFSFVPVVGKRYHLVFTMNDGYGNWYLDGKKKTLTANSQFSQNIASVVNCIGRYNTGVGTSNDLYGAMGRIEPYNSITLTDAQAYELYIRSLNPVKV